MRTLTIVAVKSTSASANAQNAKREITKTVSAINKRKNMKTLLKPMSKEEMVKRLHWLATKRVCLLRGLRMKMMMLRLKALEVK